MLLIYEKQTLMMLIHQPIYNAGFSKVMLWVFKENYMARKFYENNGFVLTEKTKVFNDAIEVMYCKYLQVINLVLIKRCLEY